MKKIALLFVGSVLLAACKQTPQTGVQSQQEVKNEMTDAGSLIAAGKPVKCEMSKTDGSMSMTSYVFGKKVKTTGITTAADAQYNGAMISDGSYVYTWDETKKEGIKMKAPSEQDLKDLASKTGQDVPNLSDENSRKSYEDQGYRISCVETRLSDSDFIPPTDIKFTDASAMMESVNKMMQQGNSGEAPSAADQQALEEKAKELMKQYGGNQ